MARWVHGLLLSVCYQGLPILALAGLMIWLAPIAWSAGWFFLALGLAMAVNFGLLVLLERVRVRCPRCGRRALAAATTGLRLEYRCEACGGQVSSGFALRGRFSRERFRRGR